MGLRFNQILLLLALLMVVESSPMARGVNWGAIAQINGPGYQGIQTCNGQVGDCIDEAEEMMMDSEASRRTLALGQRFISYRAFKKDHVPCNRRGQSYYTCYKKGRTFP